MKKGFTILELLVASLLLGMLMTVLTMIFNQSSISWRIGQASIADLDTASGLISSVRHESDNLYPWGSDAHALLSIWDPTDPAGHTMRKRAIDAGITVTESEKINNTDVKGAVTASDQGKWGQTSAVSEDAHGGANNYTVNVMSAGPNKEFSDYDDIWSFPNEFQ